MRVILGTAQFGLDYGISNRRGIVDHGEIERILDVAHERGIRTLDTASAYGDAEELLGGLLRGRFEIATKFSSAEIGGNDPRAEVRDKVHASIGRLNVERLSSVLLHDSAFLLGAKVGEVLDELERLKVKGLVGSIGVSVYEESDLPASVPRAISIVQGPLNLLDWRLGTSDLLTKSGLEFHARSVFLQGLLTMKLSDMPEWISPYIHHVYALEEFLQSSNQTAVEACIRHVLSFTNVKGLVIGVTNVDELCTCMDAFSRGQLRAPSYLATADVGLIDPRNWPGQ
jgi:aryl-alcohol dehydrogenase-like predicted oxidoreductase